MDYKNIRKMQELLEKLILLQKNDPDYKNFEFFTENIEIETIPNLNIHNLSLFAFIFI